MTGKRNKEDRETNPSSEDVGPLQSEIDKLNRELRAFVAVALQHGLRDYCEARHPKLTADLEKFNAHSPLNAKQKYESIISRIRNVPGLQGTPGDTAERIYYRNAQDNVAYIEHTLKRNRFVLGGIWVAPHYRGKGLAHKILRVLVEPADEADLSIELYHEPFGEEGLRVNELEAFLQPARVYNA